MSAVAVSVVQLVLGLDDLILRFAVVVLELCDARDELLEVLIEIGGEAAQLREFIPDALRGLLIILVLELVFGREGFRVPRLLNLAVQVEPFEVVSLQTVAG